jgi:hypothetical protein
LWFALKLPQTPREYTGASVQGIEIDTVKMNPIIILPPKAMSGTDIELLRKNGLCVVVAENPATVKFVDPIPAASSRTQIEDAAIKLSRKILSPGFWTNDGTRDSIARTYMDILIKGTALDPSRSQAELEQTVFNDAKRDELIRLAREEAKAERTVLKQVKKVEPK